jgi:hypothetical protein
MATIPTIPSIVQVFANWLPSGSYTYPTGVVPPGIVSGVAMAVSIYEGFSVGDRVRRTVAGMLVQQDPTGRVIAYSMGTDKITPGAIGTVKIVDKSSNQLLVKWIGTGFDLWYDAKHKGWVEHVVDPNVVEALRQGFAPADLTKCDLCAYPNEYDAPANHNGKYRCRQCRYMKEVFT